MTKNKELNIKITKIYLITLMSYVLILFSVWIYQLIREYISGPLDWEFAISTLLASLVFGIFNLFNLICLVYFLRNRYSKRLILLTLVEPLYLLGTIGLSILGLDFLLTFFDSIYLIYIIKLLQLIVASGMLFNRIDLKNES